MTDLVERYIAAVGRELPDAQRTDITAELRDELLSQIEGREAELGRPLRGEELEAELLAFGNPRLVAGRYRKVQQLVGPEIYPLWWAAMKAALAVVAAIYLVLLVLTVAFEGAGPVVEAFLPDLFTALVAVFGGVTLTAVAIERAGLTRLFYRWRPRRLPPAASKPKSSFETGIEVGLEIVFILWWMGLIQFRDWLPATVVEVELAPVWQSVYWPVLAYSAVGIGANLLRLALPEWTRIHAALGLARAVAGAAIAGVLLPAEHFVEIPAGALSAAATEEVRANFDICIRLALGVTLASYVVGAALEGRRLGRAIVSAVAPPDITGQAPRRRG